MRKALLVIACLTASVSFAACGGDDDGTSGTSAATDTTAAAACDKASLTLKTAGTLTLGTDNPAFPPWFGGGEKNKPWEINDPSTGEGYESAVAYAVAGKLGFAKDEVKWKVVKFDTSFAPGPKDFDAFVNQVSITPERAQNVDFSSGYYNVNQAVVGLGDKPIASATSLADLKKYKLGAAVGTTSLSAIEDKVQPDTKASVYNTNDDAVAALKAAQIDGIVVDLPTGYFVTAAQVEGSKIVGQFPTEGGEPEQFGMVLEKDSPLTACVSKAVDDLRADGTLEKLETQWLAGAAAPFLK
jgi:polar amino acid transport system substrate-binding protein